MCAVICSQEKCHTELDQVVAVLFQKAFGICVKYHQPLGLKTNLVMKKSVIFRNKRRLTCECFQSRQS